MRKNTPTSFRLTSDAHTLLTKLSEKLGIPQTNVLEIAIRRFAEQEGIELDKDTDSPM